MTRALAQTVVAGGVVYPVGTPATAELEEKVTNPDHWSGKVSDAAGEKSVPRKQSAKGAAKSSRSKDS